MGTVVSVASPEEVPPEVLEAVASAYRDADERFSLYRAHSEASRIARGEQPMTAASLEFRRAYELALDWRRETGGAFTPHRPDGVTDLSGIVKAMATETAAGVLTGAGIADWCLSAGGDVLASGASAPGSVGATRVGIVDPADRRRLLGSLLLERGRRAVATSGSAERGDHIWRAVRAAVPAGVSPRHFVQATVVAADIVTADVVATAVIAAGPPGLDDLTARFDVDVLTVDSAGALLATPGMRRLIAGATAR